MIKWRSQKETRIRVAMLGHLFLKAFTRVNPRTSLLSLLFHYKHYNSQFNTNLLGASIFFRIIYWIFLIFVNTTGNGVILVFIWFTKNCCSLSLLVSITCTDMCWESVRFEQCRTCVQIIIINCNAKWHKLSHRH